MAFFHLTTVRNMKFAECLRIILLGISLFYLGYRTVSASTAIPLASSNGTNTTVDNSTTMVALTSGTTAPNIASNVTKPTTMASTYTSLVLPHLECPPPCNKDVEYQRIRYNQRGQQICYCAPIPVSAGKCFPFYATASLSDGREVTLDSLRPGDAVLAFDDDEKTLIFSDVLLILDQNPSKVVEFIELWTENSSSPLVVSPDHIIFTRTEGAWTTTTAGGLASGDVVAVVPPGGAGVSLRRVTLVSKRLDFSVIAPLTVHGTIVVNGVLTSCYSWYPDHDLCHLMYAPVRLLHSLGLWLPLGGDQYMTGQAGVHWTSKLLLSFFCMFADKKFC